MTMACKTLAGKTLACKTPTGMTPRFGIMKAPQSPR
jgi:hypothetical protein